VNYLQEDRLEALMPSISDWFLRKREYFETFSEVDSRLEGWFKGECLLLFSRFVANGLLDGFVREKNIPGVTGRNQIDFSLSLEKRSHLLELKALCISQAAGTPRNLHFYFRDDQVGLFKDFRKLEFCLVRINMFLHSFIQIRVR